jgi:hypothetical protein
MKKTIMALAVTLAATAASAANFVSLDVDRVKDDKTGVVSHAQYVRVGKDVAGLNLGLQARTASFEGGGMLNSLEGTVGKQMGMVNVFGGLGHDNGFNGGRSFQYGLVGASAGMPVGPVYAFGGVKTRVNWNDRNPAQTVAFAGVSVPIAKQFSLSVGGSKSYQDIKETAWGLGVRVGF